ncbi:MAG TPA: CHASE2 domain-containing protein [Acidiferrobacteraceae bacterium]|nr:CHASE2 domain-containing protein [Acidiferrobacteraceae bacterium]
MKVRPALPLIPLLAIAVTAFIQLAPVSRVFERKTVDLLFRAYADPDKADKRIVILEVDQLSLDHYERDNISFPWPRSLYNPLIAYLNDSGVKAIIFDILFNNMSPYGEAVDARFAKAISQAGNVTLAATTRSQHSKGDRLKISQKFGLAYKGTAPLPIRRHLDSLPQPVMLQAAAALGSVSLGPDPDGVYRKVKPFTEVDGYLIPALFSAPLFMSRPEAVFTPHGLRVGEHLIPIDGDGNIWINYHGPRGTYLRISIKKAMDSALQTQEDAPPNISATLSKDLFKDAYVIIGYSAPGLFDLKPTPLHANSPGIEIQAAALDTLLNNNYLEPAPYWWSVIIAYLGAFLVAAAVIRLINVIAPIAVFLAVAVALFAIVGLAFSDGLLLNLLCIETSALVAFIGASIFRYNTEGRQRRFISEAFSHYVSPKVVAQIIAEPERLTLGGEKKELSILFTDLVGFTSLSETLSANALVNVLNQYTTLVSDVVMQRDGTVDKYIGDAVMAFWSAPIIQTEHARSCVLAALECQQKMASFRQAMLKQYGVNVAMRVGINTGMCIVGNMGSRSRFDYTAIGDAVNQTSRLEALNKTYGTSILVSEAAWKASGKVAFGRLIDYLKVKGKEIPIRAYEAMCLAGEQSDDMAFLKKHYDLAFEAYTNRQWDDVIKITEFILKQLNDGPSNILFKRAQQFRKTPPSDAWDGSYTHSTK